MPNKNIYARRRNALKAILFLIALIVVIIIVSFIVHMAKHSKDNDIPHVESQITQSTESTKTSSTSNHQSETTTIGTTSNTTQTETVKTTQSTQTTEVTTQADSIPDSSELTLEQKKQYVLDHKEKYTDDLIGFMNKYDQVVDYVYNYPIRNSLTVTTNASEEKTDTDFPLYIQWDYRWGYNQYGDSMIGIAGCGPTSLAMVYSGLTGKTDQNPASVCKLSEDKGYYVANVGTSWDLMTKGANDLGIKSEQLSLFENNLVSHLQKGHPIICSVKKGDFTYSGHFIVLTGYKDGKFIINDPNSKANSQKLWEYSVLEPQIKNLWAFYLN